MTTPALPPPFLLLFGEEATAIEDETEPNHSLPHFTDREAVSDLMGGLKLDEIMVVAARSDLPSPPEAYRCAWPLL